MAINYDNASKFSKSIGVPGMPVAFESYYFDATTSTARPYNSTAEVIGYLNTSQSRKGHKPIYVQVGGDFKEYWFKNGVTDADLVEKTALLPVVPDWVTLSGSEWNVRNNHRVIINLTKPVTVINTEDFPPKLLAEAFVKQPASGGRRLIIDSVEVGLGTVGGELKGDTRLVLEYIKGQLVISADPNAIVTKPVLDTQTFGAIALPESRTLFHAKFLDLGRTLLYRWELDGEPQKKHTGASILMKGIAANIGSWECIAIDSITKLETRAAPMTFDLGEPEEVFLIAEPLDLTVKAGEPFTLASRFGGTPPPDVNCIEVTGVSNDGTPTGPVVGEGSIFKGIGSDTKKFAFIATNTVLEVVEVTPPVYDGDGIIITPAVIEYRKKTVTKFTKPVTITVEKQEQDAPVVTVDDLSVQSTLKKTLSAGEKISMFEGTLDATAEFPQLVNLTLSPDGTSAVLTVGDINLPPGKAGIRYKSTKDFNASPWGTNSQDFTGSLISKPSNLRFTAENPADKSTGLVEWDKSVDTLNPSTQEYSQNYSQTNKYWTDIADDELAIKDNIAAGDFAIREKARPGKPASDPLVNTGQPFVTSLNANYTLEYGKDMQNLAGYQNIFYDAVKQFSVENDFNRVLRIISGATPGYYRMVQMNNFGANTVTQLAFMNEDSSLVIDGDVSGVNYVKFKGITNGGGTRGTNLASIYASGQVYDIDSPATGVQENEFINITKAHRGMPVARKYKVTEAIDYQGMRLLKLEPSGHSVPISPDLIGGIWSKVN